jgi:hypothetical protein
MAALSPGQSPPLVSMPKVLVTDFAMGTPLSSRGSVSEKHRDFIIHKDGVEINRKGFDLFQSRDFFALDNTRGRR